MQLKSSLLIASNVLAVRTDEEKKGKKKAQAVSIKPILFSAISLTLLQKVYRHYNKLSVGGKLIRVCTNLQKKKKEKEI